MQRVVGIVGADLADAVRAAGAEPTTGSVADVLGSEPDVVVAVGESALLGLVAAGVDTPVLPVDAGEGVRTVPADGVESALDALIGGEFGTASFPVLDAESPHGTTRALLDCMLVTAEPARISEFTVRSRGERVATFRADGVVVATPAGSHGYAGRAGGPVLAPETDSVVVVPIAPFSIDEDSWIVPAAGLRFTVERDETPVELLADDRTAGRVAPGESVGLSIGGRLEVAVLPESAGRFE